MAYSSMSRDALVKNLNSTSVRLNGQNYLLWSQAFETFLGVHRKICHLTHDHPDVKDAAYEDWFADDYAVISWIVNSVEVAFPKAS